MTTVVPVSRAVVCDHGFLWGSCRPPKGLHVQGLLATEQGEGEVLKGCHGLHPALNGEGVAHSHPGGLQLQQYLLWRVCREKWEVWLGGGAAPAGPPSREHPQQYRVLGPLAGLEEEEIGWGLACSRV